MSWAKTVTYVGSVFLSAMVVSYIWAVTLLMK
jgi:hypothetical protein